MCFTTTKHSRAKIAKTDIVCWKVLYSYPGERLHSILQGYYYKRGIVNPIVKLVKVYNTIQEGYHSYKTQSQADLKCWSKLKKCINLLSLQEPDIILIVRENMSVKQ
jgi:hypothetical protein